MPLVEVRSKRVGDPPIGSSSCASREKSLCIRWIVNHSRKRTGAMQDILASELIDCFKNQGATVKKKEEVHRMAEANKAFSHYR